MDESTSGSGYKATPPPPQPTWQAQAAPNAATGTDEWKKWNGGGAAQQATQQAASAAQSNK